MNDERALSVLRDAERTLQIAWQWLPFSDEVDGPVAAKRNADDAALARYAENIRTALKEAEEAVLNVAEHRGAKRP